MKEGNGKKEKEGVELQEWRGVKVQRETRGREAEDEEEKEEETYKTSQRTRRRMIFALVHLADEI